MILTKANIYTISGAKAIVNTLKKLSVDTIFGYPGGVVLDVYDELYNQSDIRHILMRHEQAAVHAAEGYARVSGKCGVVLVTSGPGATNTITGIANAYLDGYPLVVLTGQVNKNLLGHNAFQEANICEIAKSCSKAVFQIDSANNIEEVLIRAFSIANEGKKGPVVVDMVKDIFKQQTDFSKTPNYKVIPKDNNLENNNVSRILNRLKHSKKPVVIAGGGVHHSKSYSELFDFISKTNIPVVSTMMGLGGFSSNRNYFGMIGIYGDNCANEIIRQSDLIISLGCRFNDRITDKFKDIDLKSKIVQIDIDKKLISTLVPSDYIIEDIGYVLREFNEIINKNNTVNFADWLNIAQGLRKLNVKEIKISNCRHGFEVIKKLEEYTKNKNVIFSSEVGQHQLFAVKNLSFNKDRRILLSGGAGTMGFGFPAAIGAAITNPDKCVVCITGDGSFQMSLEELAVCKDLNLNIKVVILNNGYLGMVRQLQEINCDRRYSQTKISNPDFVKLAQSYGIKALKVKSPDDMDDALDKAFTQKDTFILDFEIESMEVI